MSPMQTLIVWADAWVRHLDRERDALARELAGEPSPDVRLAIVGRLTVVEAFRAQATETRAQLEALRQRPETLNGPPRMLSARLPPREERKRA